MSPIELSWTAKKVQTPKHITSSGLFKIKLCVKAICYDWISTCFNVQWSKDYNCSIRSKTIFWTKKKILTHNTFCSSLSNVKKSHFTFIFNREDTGVTGDREITSIERLERTYFSVAYIHFYISLMHICHIFKSCYFGKTSYFRCLSQTFLNQCTDKYDRIFSLLLSKFCLNASLICLFVCRVHKTANLNQ